MIRWLSTVSHESGIGREIWFKIETYKVWDNLINKLQKCTRIYGPSL